MLVHIVAARGCDSPLYVSIALSHKNKLKECSISSILASISVLGPRLDKPKGCIRGCNFLFHQYCIMVPLWGTFHFFNSLCTSFSNSQPSSQISGCEENTPRYIIYEYIFILTGQMIGPEPLGRSF